MSTCDAHDVDRLLRPGGRVVVLTPQAAGFRSDPAHVQHMDFESVRRMAADAGLRLEERDWFPLTRFAGAVFKYNGFVTIAGEVP